MNNQKLRIHSEPSEPAPVILKINRGRDPKKPKRGPTLRQVYDRHVKPQLLAKSRSKTTIRDIERALERWEEYWTSSAEPTSTSPSPSSEANPSPSLETKGERILNPFPSGSSEQIAKPAHSRPPVQLLVRGVKRRHLEEFQIHLQSATSRRGKPFAKHTINGELGSIRQILCAAESHGLLRARPRVGKLAAKPALKFYVSRDQMNKLWEKSDYASWPRLPGLSTGEWWRCALCLLWTYGFRTQELLAFQAGMTKLTWSSIHFQSETPNPAGQAHNALGWLTYVPQKQAWAKPEPLYLPMTTHTRAAIDWLASAARSQCGGQLPADRPLFPWSSSHRSLYSQWEVMQKRAEIQTKSGQPFQFKHLRKSAATYLEGHWPGLGEAVVGWADRDAAATSKVMKDHYAVDENTLVEKLATYPQPECFSQLLRKPTAQMLLFENIG